MAENGVPTARFGVFRDRSAAATFASELGERCVVKASGLAAGKGAIVCASPAEAERALDACFVRREFGVAGEEVVVEEMLEGEEVSLIAITNGTSLVSFLPSQDHKRALNGDQGPNTGGMGAYSPVSIADGAFVERALDEIFRPTLAGLAAEGSRSPASSTPPDADHGRAEGVEWNVRFGDPECRRPPLLESDLLELLVAGLARRRRLTATGRWREARRHGGRGVGGYPDAYESGARRSRRRI
jgi:phosphoribosylamine--glycine ligase